MDDTRKLLMALIDALGFDVVTSENGSECQVVPKRPTLYASDWSFDWFYLKEKEPVVVKGKIYMPIADSCNKCPPDNPDHWSDHPCYMDMYNIDTTHCKE